MIDPYASDVEFRVLGPLEVLSDGERRKLGGLKQRSVLAMLLANVGRSVSLDRIINDVYGDDADPSVRRSVMTFVSSLRRELGVEISHRSGQYSLDIDPWVIDAVAFERAVEGARGTIGFDPERARRDLRAALEMWRGHPYCDVEVRGALEPETTRLRELRLTALELRIDADLAAGRGPQLIGELEALADEYPVRERFRAQHMLALYRAGRQADALRAFRRTEQYLADELGLEPSRELRNLELQILQHDEDLIRGDPRRVTQRVAILVTEIEDATRHWDRFPESTANALAASDRLCTEAVEASEGRVFRQGAGGLLAVFGGVPEAVRAAGEAQRSLGDHDWGEVGELRARMGIDVGDAESYGGDFLGPPLTRAAGIAAAAHGGQVLVSAMAQRDLLDDTPPGVQLRPLGEHRLRGQAAAERIGQVLFPGLPADFPELRRDAEPEPGVRGPHPSLPGYEVRDVIGEGTHGLVCRAYQPSVGREVAIKVIRPEFSGDPEFVRDFEAQARTAARLAHPRIVPLYDFWRDADGAYLVMRLLPAGSLARVLGAGSIELEAGVTMIRHIAEALQHAHGQGVIHGDVAPSNVLLDEFGNAYLSDFGMVSGPLHPPEKLADWSPVDAYAAPERYGSGPTPAGDQYALGVLAHEVLTGRAPVPGAPLAPASSLANEIPEAVDAVIARAAAHDPVSRYSSIEDLLAAFDAAVAPGVAPTAVEDLVVRNPYKGLRSFDEADAVDFFGRDDLVAQLVDSLGRHRFVTVVGPSGSGKSSAVRAGLLPALRRGAAAGSERWFTAAFVPGSDPRAALEEALGGLATSSIDIGSLIDAGDLAGATEQLLDGTDGDLLLVIDQFEEVFTLVDEARHRTAFLDLVTKAVTVPESRVRVVATLRADFYDRPLACDGLDRLVSDGLVTVLRPERDELIEMITRPAVAVGLLWEPGLPARIVSDVQGSPGSLPLLQYALTELVERCDGPLLTGVGYDRIGGATGALASRAEAAFGDLPPGRQAIAQEVLLRLVTVGEEGETRRRVRRSEFETLGLDRAGLDTVLELLVARRLLTTDRDPTTRGPTVEVAHETMLSLWPRLRKWIDTRRVALILSRRFRAAMEDWKRSGRDAGYLLVGSRLAPYVAWAEDSVLTAAEQEFFDASNTKSRAEQTAATRRRRILVGILAAATLIAVALSALALWQRSRADREAALAQSRAFAASALSLLDTDPELGVVLAARAVEIDPDNPTHLSTLHDAAQRDRTMFGVKWEAERTPWGLMIGSMSPDGRYVAVAAFGRELEVWDTTAAEAPLWSKEFAGEESETMDVSFSADGSTVIAFVRWSRWVGEPPPDGYQDTIYLFDAATGDEFRTVVAPECFEGLVPTGRYPDLGGPLFAVSAVRTEDGCGNWAMDAGVFDLDSGEYRPVTDPVGYSEVGWATASADGRFVAIGLAGPGQVVEVASGESVFTFDGGVSVLSADGSRVVTGGASPKSVKVWDLTTGEQLREIRIDEDVTGASWSADESMLYVLGTAGAVYRFDVSSGEQVLRARAGANGVVAGMPGPHDARFVAFYSDASMRVLDVAHAMRGEISSFDVIPPGGSLVSVLSTARGVGSMPSLEWWSGRSTVTLFDADSGEVLRTLDAFIDSQLTGDGRLVAIQPMLEDADLTDAETGEGLGGVYQRIGPVQIVDTATGEVLVEMEGLCEWFNHPDHEVPGPGCGEYPAPFADYGRLAFSADGSRLAMAGWITQSVTVWDAATGALVWNSGPLEELFSATDVGFTPDGRRLVAGSKTAMRVFDTESGELLAEAPTENQFFAMAFAHGGDRMFATDGNGVRVFDTTDWVEVEWFDIGPALDLSLSPDGSRLAVGTRFEEVLVLDSTTGVLLQSITFPGVDFPANVAFVNDDHLLVTTAAGGPVVLVTLDPQELIEIASAGVTRGPTDEECATYVLEPCPSLEAIQAG